jgi:type II secretory ATPase GspE/PulE/Tfp pilus assembly ATPase PilB-like protein
VSTLPTLYGENLVARVLNSDPSHISFSSLGIPEDVLAQLRQDLAGSSQVILVTGPTGSGKTSTLYAGLMQLRDGSHNIITIEDPIEYRLSGVTQIQVNQTIGMTFADALRSVLRQDPDVVVVGEIRDGATPRSATLSKVRHS